MAIFPKKTILYDYLHFGRYLIFNGRLKRSAIARKGKNVVIKRPEDGYAELFFQSRIFHKQNKLNSNV